MLGVQENKQEVTKVVFRVINGGKIQPVYFIFIYIIYLIILWQWGIFGY